MSLKLKIISLLLVMSGFIFWGYKYILEKPDDIILNGNVEIQDVNVSFRVSGRIKAVLFEEGARVKKGETLAVMDSDMCEAIVSYSKAKIEEAEINLNNCKKDYDRNVDLFKKKSVSEKLFDDICVKYKTAKAQRDAAASGYSLARIRLNDCVLKSPVDGIILTRNIETGEMVNSGVPAFSIMPDEKTKIKTFANEEVLAKIRYNDVVYVNIESNKNKKFQGHICFISSEAEFTPKNIETAELRTSLMYRIRVLIDDPAPELKQGMPVTIKYGNK
ncbi:MAG: efflux RND transporter periplasmic adaptor subunit [Holosporales bacterium]|jgi:HlyD family secretion protein|nr:efflux RND transporter periplasmic adaptor subunit [Holosporales bacterium]